MVILEKLPRDKLCVHLMHRCELPGNYPYFEKYGNLPLCLENYALFLLPSIFTTVYIHIL